LILFFKKSLDDLFIQRKKAKKKSESHKFTSVGMLQAIYKLHGRSV